MLKNNKILKIVLITITILSILLMLGGNIFASSKNSGIFTVPEPQKSPISEWFGKAGGTILGIFQVIGTVVAIVILVWLGIKYIMASPDGKAEIKKQAFAYVLGAVLLFGASWIVPIIQGLVNSMKT